MDQRKLRVIVFLAVFAMVFVIAGAGAAFATNPNAGCDQQPYDNTTGNGANHSGAYDDTCDGSASQNGNGNGHANGKPCAGCVGNADEKNPPGQAPDGSDDNKGYECDENSGVGKSNPAHTGCTPSENPPGEEENPPGGNNGGNPPEVLGKKFTKPLATTGAPMSVVFAAGMIFLATGTGLRIWTRRTA